MTDDLIARVARAMSGFDQPGERWRRLARAALAAIEASSPKSDSDSELLAAIEQVIPYTWRTMPDFEAVLRDIGVFVRDRERLAAWPRDAERG